MASSLTGDINIAASSIFSSSATAEHTLGARAKTADGRIFRYVQAGATALVPGKLYQAPVEVTTGNQDVAPAATAVGATQVTITLGGTNGVTANQYAGGFLVGTVTPGQGYMYRISSHPAAAASATCVVTLEDPILVALTTSSRMDFVADPYKNVIIMPTTATGTAAGVAVFPVTASQYGWLQTGGPAPLLADGGITVGTTVTYSDTTAGAVEPNADALDLRPTIGIAITGIATTEYGAVRLLLDC